MVQLKLFFVVVLIKNNRENTVKNQTHLHACEHKADKIDASLQGSCAQRLGVFSVLRFLFLLVQMQSGLANTLKTESLKQPHFGTRLIHSLLISSYIRFFCSFVCCYACI